MENKGKNPVDQKLNANPTSRTAKRVVIAVVGGAVLLVGIALLVLPGPAFLVIPAGLGILALEFEWPRRWLRKVREFLRRKREERKAARKRSQ